MDNSRMGLKLKSAGSSITALLDTGSSVTLLSSDIFRIICQSTGRPPLAKPVNQICGLGGSILKTLGSCQIAFDKVGPVEVLIVENLAYPMILGSDALHNGFASVHYPTNSLVWHGQRYPLFALPNSGPIGSVTTTVGTGNTDLDAILAEYTDIFASKDKPLGLCNILEAEIDTDGARPIRQRAYSTPLAKRRIIEDEIESMLENGIIRPSASPWASPITMVPKKDGSTRFCIDYRKLNNVVVKNAYPLPLIRDIFAQLGDMTVFSTLDMKAGYWQIPMNQNSISKTAFICHKGLFEFLRLPFGLTSSGSIFQHVVNTALHGLVGSACLVYLDDVVVFGRNVHEHNINLQKVLERFRYYNLQLKPSKCHFLQQELLLLGHIVKADGISPNPEKTRAIAALPPPTCLKGLRSFLGMTGYYRNLLPNYAHIAQPLMRLLSPKIKFEWSVDTQLAFDQLKTMLQKEPVLAYPDPAKPYKLYTDASQYAVGAVLTQEKEGTERVIQYVSHTLSKVQQRWPIVEKEAYAILHALKTLRTYLWGAKFAIYTDHKPLNALLTSTFQNAKVQSMAHLSIIYLAETIIRQIS